MTDNEIDTWVENQTMLEAIAIHPREFTALEIVNEFNADNLDEMTDGMAEVITREWFIDEMTDEELNDLEPTIWWPLQHAWRLLYA